MVHADITNTLDSPITSPIKIISVWLLNLIRFLKAVLRLWEFININIYIDRDKMYRRILKRCYIFRSAKQVRQLI